MVDHGRAFPDRPAACLCLKKLQTRAKFWGRCSMVSTASREFCTAATSLSESRGDPLGSSCASTSIYDLRAILATRTS
jgi:hypothetical protein